MMFRTSALQLLFLLGKAQKSTSELSVEYKPNTWYQKYDRYPDYCSVPERMAERAIPPLHSALPEYVPYVGETRLLHVTAVIRHGARTPWMAGETCWDGYWDNPETGVWDCDLTTMLAPPSPNSVHEEEQDWDDWEPDDAFFLFEKKYDALQYPQDGLTNELNGTCQVGQLLLQGYEQELQNGRLLREAYAFEYDSYDHEENMRLIDLSFRDYSPWDPYHLRYRADDDQRTLMSGQVLLRGLFDEEVMTTFYKQGTYPNIPVHTADRERDILDANPDVCPRITVALDAALQSAEYQAFNQSDLVRDLREFVQTKLGKSDPTHILDCLMTTICTDRPLPEAIDDYGTGESKFESLAQVVSRTTVVQWTKG
jgi:hypothetical protein